MYEKTSAVLPNFIVDWNGIDRTGGRQIDWPSVGDQYRSGAVRVEIAANAAADAESLSLENALTGALSKGTVLQFGPDKYATLTAAAAEGATTLAVEPLTTALVDGDVAYYGGTGKKVIPAGSAMHEQADGTLIPRDGDNAATGILLTDATEGVSSDAKSGYGYIRGGGLYEERLPFAGDAALATIKTELGSRFYFESCADSRAS